MPPVNVPGSGGLHVTDDMQACIRMVGTLIPLIHVAIEQCLSVSGAFDSTLLSDFGLCCYLGMLDGLSQMIMAGLAPDLTGTETPFQFGYATLIIAGSQRLSKAIAPYRPVESLKYLVSLGAPVDSGDIVGLTALHHSSMRTATPTELIRALLECGANPNHRNRYGEVPILGAFQANQIDAINLLMEYGADLEIEDADSYSPSKLYLSSGPQVTAAVRKWMRKRNGEDALMEEKECNRCRRKGAEVKLSVCGKCHVTRYCSTECQRSDWPTHKKMCQPFSAENTVTLKPFYHEGYQTLMPTATIVRNALNIPTPPTPSSHHRAAHTPKSLALKSKSIIIKIQVPVNSFDATHRTTTSGPLLVYTKKRDFACTIRRTDNPTGYDKVVEVVKTKGVGGAKAYFAAELKSEDVLVVKISEVVAEQPF